MKPSNYADQMTALREKLANDPHRPQYHFLPPANWMNDPNGLIQWQGQYHLFYQHNPNGPFAGTIHWGHAVSEDLVHWTHLPVALAPTPGGPDQDGCWSGCAADNNGIPTLIYTGVHPQCQCMATSRDELLTWEKYIGNPVIAAPPENLNTTGFRDPCVWREGNIWCMLIGSGIQEVGGTALLYKSPDLIHWEYISPILIGDQKEADPLRTGTMWECPDFFPLGGKHVLVVSAHWGKPLYTIYFIGTYANDKFAPTIVRKLDFGDTHFYAPRTLLDDKGRRIMWGWIREARSEGAQRAAGWCGVMSLPRILSARPDGLLGIEPAPELAVLRGEHYHITEVQLTPMSSPILGDIRGDCLEIIMEFQPDHATDAGMAEQFGIEVRCSPDGTEQTRIVYDRLARRLAIDRERSSLSSDVHRGRQEGALEMSAGESLKLHLFLDRSVIEVYANGRACVTSRVYPSRADSLGVALFALGGSIGLKTMDVWQMGSIWSSGS